MILAYLGREIDYPHLLQLLDIQSYGAPAGNIRQLTQLNLNVTYSQTDNLAWKQCSSRGNRLLSLSELVNCPTGHTALIMP
jgi:hypothetical protein